MTRLLTAAAQHGRVEIMTMLLDAGTNINAVDGIQWSACHFAAKAGHLDALKLLIARGANCSTPDLFDLSPLVHASRLPDDSCTLALLDAGVSLERMKPSHLLDLVQQSANVTKRLLKRNFDFMSLRDIPNNGTLCHIVAQSERNDVLEHLQLLVNQVGIDIDARDNTGLSAVHYAAIDRERALRALIFLGADIDAVDSFFHTALSSRCSDENCSIGCVELLLAAGANIRIDQACHWAALRNPGAFRACLAVGADLDELNGSHYTPRQLAAFVSVALPTDDEIDLTRRRIASKQLELVRDRATEVGIGLQSLGLDALRLCEIMLHACGPVAPMVPFHRWWQIATTIKHFHKIQV